VETCKCVSAVLQVDWRARVEVMERQCHSFGMAVLRLKEFRRNKFSIVDLQDGLHHSLIG
jgi:hypothetical protein